MRSHAGFAILTLAALVGCSTPTRHWSPVATPRTEDWHAPYNLLLRYDADNNGVITRRELEAGLRQDFRQADTNHDGRLDPDEVRAYNLRRIRIDESTAIPLIDWNDDGYVDFGEFAAGMRSLFEQYDADGDGNVTLDEMHIRLQKVVPAVPHTDPVPNGTH
jgi:Ca2+-binding EF-hand superfamily protein